MASVEQIWESHDGWRALELRYFVHQDFSVQGNIGKAFDFVVSARLLGAQLGSATVKPVQNGPVDLHLVDGNAIHGQLDDWQGYLANGSKAAWDVGNLATARFLLTLDIDVHLPIGQIQIKAFHKPCTVALHWDATTKKYVYLPVPV